MSLGAHQEVVQALEVVMTVMVGVAHVEYLKSEEGHLQELEAHQKGQDLICPQHRHRMVIFHNHQIQGMETLAMGMKIQ